MVPRHINGTFCVFIPVGRAGVDCSLDLLKVVPKINFSDVAVKEGKCGEISSQCAEFYSWDSVENVSYKVFFFYLDLLDCVNECIKRSDVTFLVFCWSR